MEAANNAGSYVLRRPVLKTQVVAIALLTLLAGCSADSGSERTHAQLIAPDPAETSADPYALGSNVTPAGAVPKDAEGESFRRGGQVFLSVDVASASADQNIEVEWRDGSNRILRRDAKHVPVGSHYASFSSGREVSGIAGPRTAIVIINGRRVSERTFTIM